MRRDRATGQCITILVDSGATYNYISTKTQIGESVPLPQIYNPKTLHGHSEVSSKKIINVLGHDLTFFEIKELFDYDMILGDQGLRQIKANLDFFVYKLYYHRPNIQHKINYTNDNSEFKNEIAHLMQKNENLSENLPFTTAIQASIRTKNDEPIYTKQYPYPASDREFVDNEITKLINNGIIEKSFSPYNSPIWVVPKKGFDENNKPKRRLVIDYQKLNSHTITDKFPIPDINMTIQNLGKARIFSTIDLESGYHQIAIRKDDREKTAFSINHAKFQFRRMPFGLKNAPSIFQRCVNDILHKYIGKFAYVYIDDVLIFSNTEEEHMEHISLIVQALHEANMKISNEKSHFFKHETEFLGHIIKHGKITVDPEKIATIREYQIPQTLKQLRSFLGLAGYYRKFIRDFAKITKPLTIHLKSENGRVKAKQSSKVPVALDQAAIEAFKKIKVLLQEQIELYQPDFNKPFQLTTDASNFAIGAVLSQDRHPITFVSRTLTTTEQNYATNEKEILAIVWALQKLRNYLYGVSDLTIYTDHQSLIHSISEKNPNTKLKRWKNFIAEFGAEVKYKPGYQNIVADALSRHHGQINFSNTNETMHSMQSSPTEKIKRIPFPLNRFKNQIEIIKSDHNSLTSKTIFPNHVRHKIKFKTIPELMTYLENIVSRKHVNAIYSTEETFFFIKESISNTFLVEKFIFTTSETEDITDLNEQLHILSEIHKRAHRNAMNNFIEAQRTYFWPTMKRDFVKYVRMCEICKTQKYERVPVKQPIGSTPIPTTVGESISMDLFYIDNKIYVTSVDRYSKYLIIHPIQSKENFHEKLEEILTQNYPKCKTLMTDNEGVLISNAAKFVYRKYGIIHVTTPIQHSTSNGTIERTHSTLIELIRCLSTQNKTSSTEEIFSAVKAYNETIHSVTHEKPIDVRENPNNFPNISEKIMAQQKQTLEYHNKNKTNRSFRPGEEIFVKSNRRRKDASAYVKHIVKEDLGNSILTTKNKEFHKDNIRINK